jgi:hypothetical protein
MDESSRKPKPYPANVPGDFYVEDGCCTMCKVPLTFAPDLFGVAHDPAGYEHCYVRRQPETAAEFDQMMSTIQCADLGCIRYRGEDRLIQLRLVEIGEGDQCDKLPSDLRQEVERQVAENKRRRRPWWRFW